MRNEIVSFVNLGNHINVIDRLKGEIDKAPFEELAVGYENLKTYEKSVTGLTGLVNNEIKNKRFNTKNCGIKVNEKGDQIYGNLRKEVRIKYELNTEEAKKLLKQEKMLGKVMEKVPTISELKEFLIEVQEKLPKKEWEKLESEYINYSNEFNEDKWQDLLKKVSPERKELFKLAYDKKETSYLHIDNKRKKE